LSASTEIAQTIRNYGLWSTLGWADIKFRYRRTIIGPFWLVLSTGITIFAIGVMYAGLFRTRAENYVPFLACGMIIWGFINTTIAEGCNTFITASSIIKSSSIPLSVHVFRLLWRNIVTFLHSFAIIIVTWAYFRWTLGPSVLFVVLGLAILSVFLFGLVLVLSVICTRFRDMPQIVTSFLQLVFFLTPIIWAPTEKLKASVVVWLNPFYSLMEVVRGPLLGQTVGALEWTIALGVTAVTLIVGLLMYARFRHIIAYWL
jgi:ABC-type polysaccharide/polyol phosphate export permease